MTDDDLAVVSRLVADLEGRPTPALGTLEDIGRVFAFLSKSLWSSNSIDEKREVLAHLAFLGWRHARLLGQAKESQKWSERHELAFAAQSTERDCVQYFLETMPSERSAPINRAFLSDPRRVFAVCAVLREWSNIRIADVGVQASAAFGIIRDSARLGEGDEHEWFLAELALLAGSSHRTLGNSAAAELWLDKVSNLLGHLNGATPMVARLAYARLSLQYDCNEWRSVLGQVAKVAEAFEALGMKSEAAKTRFVEAMALKNCLRDKEAVAELEMLRTSLADGCDIGLLGQVLSELGAFYAAQGGVTEAEANFAEALGLLLSSNRLFGVANLKLSVGEALRSRGRTLEAIQTFREAVELFAGLGMGRWAAYSRVVLADALLILGRPEEAEKEIFRALPILEAEEMAAEGVAACSILREAVQKARVNRSAFRKPYDCSAI